MVTGDIDAAHRAVRSGACGGIISPSVVAPAERALGFTRGALVRDPDGHALQLIEP